MRATKLATCSCSTSRVHWDVASRAPCVRRSRSLQRTALPSEVFDFCSCGDSTGLQVIQLAQASAPLTPFFSAMVSSGAARSLPLDDPHVLLSMTADLCHASSSDDRQADHVATHHAHPALCDGANACLQEVCEQAGLVLADAAQQAQRFTP